LLSTAESRRSFLGGTTLRASASASSREFGELQQLFLGALNVVNPRRIIVNGANPALQGTMSDKPRSAPELEISYVSCNLVLFILVIFLTFHDSYIWVEHEVNLSHLIIRDIALSIYPK